MVANAAAGVAAAEVEKAITLSKTRGGRPLGTPSPTNPLGVKGCGEAGTIGAMPSIMNAIIDALDGQQMEMPATVEKLWRAARAM